jgi:hypothetical protein
MRFPGVVDDGFDAQRDAVLQVLLQPGIPVEHVEGDQVAVPVDLGLEATAGGREGRPPEPLAAAEQQFHVLRAAQVHVLAQQRLEERAGMNIVVEDQAPSEAAPRTAEFRGSGRT